MKMLDRILACLLMLGGVGHTAGTLMGYRTEPMMMLWSLSASLFVFFYGGVNLVRAGRAQDKALSWLCLAGGIGWIAISLRFGQLIGDLLDFRPAIFIVLTLSLCGMCVRTLAARDTAG